MGRMMAAAILLTMCSSAVNASPFDSQREKRVPEAMTLRAKDIYGDKTLLELNQEISYLDDDLLALQDEYSKHQARITDQISRLRAIISERQDAVSFIKRDGSQRYFVVRQGMLRSQLEDLRFALGLQTIRWAKNIPPQCDWKFDSSFNIDKKNPSKALEAFFSGLPLLPQVHERDHSATISALAVIKCD